MPTKLSDEDVTRLQDLGAGWEGSKAPVMINARDAAALGFPLDADLKKGEPLHHATVKGHELFIATRDLQVGRDVATN